MAAIKSKGTKLEKRFFKAIAPLAIEDFEYYPEDIPGKPDLAHRDSRIAIFVDSCYWHGCPQHLRMPSSNRDYWSKKIARNRRRDRKIKKELEDEGWKVLRIWEHSINNPRALKWWVTRINNLVNERRASEGRGNDC